VARILAFTDPHGDLEAVASILDLAARERPDLVVCPGDISTFGEDYEAFLDRLAGLGREVLFTPGNHDNDRAVRDILRRYPWVRNLENRRLEAAGIAVAGLPGSEPFWPDGREDAAEVRRSLDALGPRDRARPLLLLTHFPPWRSALSGLTYLTPDSGGSMTVRKIVEALEPDLLVCGHYHQDFGKTDRIGPTRLVNPGPRGALLALG
jgi:Icc-related predicted phosphoesterase